MIDPPKRTGYRLTYDAEYLYNDWQEIGGCSCHTGCAPCSGCCHDGHPISLEENDEAWELDYTIADVYNAWKLKQEMEMSRQDITNKSDPPKSEWFNGKYRVTPETSKLLQEAVFKDGGGWWAHSKEFMDLKYDNYWLFVTSDGELSWSTTDVKGLPEKQPPQPAKVEPIKKDFVVGKYYKCLVNAFGFLGGKYYRLGKVQGNLWFDGTVHYVSRGCFDINSESDYDPNAAHPAGYTAYVVFKQDFTEGALQKGEYGGKEYAYKCSRDDYTQWVEYRVSDEDVFAEVSVSGVEKKVKVLRIEAKVDPKATKSIVRILPKGVDTEIQKSKIDIVAKDVEEIKLRTYRAEDVTVTVSGYEVQRFQPNDFFSRDDVNLVIKHFNQPEENIMSNQNRVVSVKFFDDDAGLKAENSLVAEYQVTTRVSDQMTISKVLLTEDVAGDIELHNGIRANTVDLHILKQTGNKVMLQPVEFEDLRVEVRQV